MKKAILFMIAMVLVIVCFRLSAINDTLKLELTYAREHTTTVIVTNTVTPVEIRTEHNIYQPPQPQWQWQVATNWSWPPTGGILYISTPCVEVSGRELR